MSRQENLRRHQWDIISQSVNEKILAELFESLRSHHVEPIVIKGWSVSRFYPPTQIRTYSDIDLAVGRDEFQILDQALKCLKPRVVPVDSHVELRDRDTIPWEDLFAHSYTVELNGVPIRVLSDEDNLRVTAVHWLIDGGVYKEKLWDIYYLVKNRKPDFDWERCIDAAGPIRRSWVIAAIATARDYLDLDVSDLIDPIRNAQLPNWFKKTLELEWNRGPYPRLPLWLCIGKPRIFWQQLRRRFPPNRIAATMDTEVPIDGSSRISYQFRSVLKKILPAVSGLARKIRISGK